MRPFARNWRLISSAPNLTFSRLNGLRRFSDMKDEGHKERPFRPMNIEPISKAEIKKKIEADEETLLIDKQNGIFTISINRIRTRNSLNLVTLKALSDALIAFDQDPTCKVLILNGEGGTFCSGFDTDEILKWGHDEMKEAAKRLLRRPLCDKPVICAVSGFAVAEGFELALACDIRLVETSAALGFLGRRFGIMQSLNGSARLTSLIGLSRTMELIATGRLMTGSEAHIYGIAFKATSTGTALGESVKLAKNLIKFPQSALIMDKLNAINSQLDPKSEDRIRNELLVSSLFGSAVDDLTEGVQKFKLKGIGRHGKFSNLTEMPRAHWELDNNVVEKT